MKMRDLINLLEDISSNSVIVSPPSEISSDVLQQIVALISEGGQVDSAGLSSRLSQAAFVAYVLQNNKVISVGALKNPNRSYKDGVFLKAGVKGDRYNLELGYLFTDPESRGQGLSRQCVNALLGKVSQPVFATVRKDNTASQNLLTSSGFKIVGKPYQGMSGQIVLLING